MIALLMRLRPFLPQDVWQRMRDAYWRCYWRREEKAEARALSGAPRSRIAGSERAVLAEAIADSYPFSSLLEVGCAYGQNFYTCAAQFPHSRFTGVDLDAEKVKEGQALLLRRGLGNVVLEEGDAADLSRYAARSFDLVISCACLLFCGPAAVEHVLAEMIRVSAKKVLLLEQHEERTMQSGSLAGSCRERAGGGTYWVWDYGALLKPLVGGEQISITKVPAPRWDMESWRSTGALIEVRLNG
ncbi:MAG TPA: class I SAM-dependent methyltransferase [Oligoflexia bacterium]|nr:class I SAM-dependent methyltransferase [Oligoflexia bacterium]